MNINANESCIYLAEKSWIKAQSNLKYAHCLFLLYLEYIFGVARFKLDICQNVVRISNAHVISDQCNKVKTAKKLYLCSAFHLRASKLLQQRLHHRYPDGLFKGFKPTSTRGSSAQQVFM